MVEDNNLVQINPLQQLQLNTGLSKDICLKLLDKESEYTFEEYDKILEVFENVRVDLSIPILKNILKDMVNLLRILGG